MNNNIFDSNSSRFLLLKQEFDTYLNDKDRHHQRAIELMLSEQKNRLIINLNDLRRYNPQLWDEFLKSPMSHIPAFEESLNGFVKSQFNNGKFDVNQKFRLGFDGAFGSRRVDPKNLHSSHITNIMCVEGIVTKVGLCRPKVVSTVHYCEETTNWKTQHYRDAVSFTGPPTGSAYPTTSEEGHALTQEFGLSTYQDHQRVWIQDMPERANTGTIPRTVECVLSNDLVDNCKPGDRVQMIGVYRTLAGRISGESHGQFKTVLIVNRVKVIRNEFHKAITGKDVKVIKSIAKSRDVFETVARSIAPSIYGHTWIKKALVLMLLGGVEKNLANGTHIRGDINILMVGDPSTAKSQLLRAVMNTAPLAINTTGRGASGVGLTAAVVQDREGGERRLEAGAMVLADRGVVCIDEFDKMSDADRVAIHEVMEQQTVTVAKAGIHTQLNARCSVIAASNPVYGQYDRNKKPHENIALPDSLLSRFDLLFIVLDKLDTELDRAISEHVLNQHTKPVNEQNDYGGLYRDMLDSDDEEDHDPNDIWEKDNHGAASELRKEKGEVTKFLKLEFCKKLIAYCKNRSKPKLTNEATEAMAQKYAELRNSEVNRSTLPITARCFETMIRLSAAHAKLRLSKEITKLDVKEVMKILRFALQSADTNEDLVDEDLLMDEQGENVEMEIQEESDSESKEVSPKNRGRRAKETQQKRKRKGMEAKEKQKIVTKQLSKFFRKHIEITINDLIKLLLNAGHPITKKDLIEVVKQLDEEGKAFYIEADETVCKM